MADDWDPRIAHVEIQGSIRELAARLDGRLERLEVKLDERLEAIRGAIDSGDRASMQAVTIIDGSVKRLEEQVRDHDEVLRRLSANDFTDAMARLAALDVSVGDLRLDRAKFIGIMMGVGLAGGGVAGLVVQAVGT